MLLNSCSSAGMVIVKFCSLVAK